MPTRRTPPTKTGGMPARAARRRWIRFPHEHCFLRAPAAPWSACPIARSGPFLMPWQAQGEGEHVKKQAHRSPQITGVILAGGLSRRMGGGDKGLLQIAGKSMLAHVACRLRPQVNRVIINANGDARRFATLDLPVVPDTVGGFVGPLAGVLAGMRWSLANANEARWIVTAAADAPLLPGDLVARLIEAVAERPDTIALAQSHGELHPVIGLWPVALAGDLE